MSYEYENPHLQTQLEKAKEYLGENWILHLKYDSSKNPQHKAFGNGEQKWKN